MTTPLIDSLITEPWVTVAEFSASPTWLDSQDLIPGGNQEQQAGELYNQLVKASGWASRIAEQNLAAHVVFDQDRYPVDQWGQAYIVPVNNPVRQVNGLAWGSDFQDLTVVNLPSKSVWCEKGKTIVVAPYPAGFSTALSNFQFGGKRAGQDYVYVQYAYTAGYCNTTLSQAAVTGATEVYLTDPTGLQPANSNSLVGLVPGSTARIWDPVNAAGTSGGEEAFQVSPAWTGGNPVILAAPLVNNHAAGAGVSEMPPEVHQAVICLTVALLCREDVSDEEPFSRTPFGPTVRQSKKGGKAGGLVDHAVGILHRYRPQVH